MSHSPTASLSNSSESVPKKRKTIGQGDMSMAASSQQQSHIPKRGARACTSCRKGKNRCEGEVRTVFLVLLSLTEARQYRSRPGSYQQPPCRRCQASGTPCIFEKPEKKNAQGLSTASVEYALSFTAITIVSHLSAVGVYPGLRASTWYSQLHVLSLNPYRLVVSGHAKPDDWHAIFARQNSISSPNSKR